MKPVFTVFQPILLIWPHHRSPAEDLDKILQNNSSMHLSQQGKKCLKRKLSFKAPFSKVFVIFLSVYKVPLAINEATRLQIHTATQMEQSKDLLAEFSFLLGQKNANAPPSDCSIKNCVYSLLPELRPHPLLSLDLAFCSDHTMTLAFLTRALFLDVTTT